MSAVTKEGDQMDEIKRIECALEHVMNASVITISRADWEILVDGEPTRVVLAPVEMKGLLSPASLVSVVGSGIYNPSPGVDIVRYDLEDSPFVYNIDHYKVLENFSDDPNYQRVLNMVGIIDSDALQVIFKDYVFIVGPYRLDNHWSIEIPEAIRNAGIKGVDK